MDDTSQSAYFKRAYALYALTLSGDRDAIQQINRFDDVVLPRSARFLLAAALMHSTQDSERVSYYLTHTPSEPYLISERDGTLNSDIRNTAIELITLQQTNLNTVQKHEKAEKLIKYLESQRYGNTQETAFIVSALGNYFDDITESIDSSKASIQLTEPSNTFIDSITGTQFYTNKTNGTQSFFTIQNEGASDLFLNSTHSGIPNRIQKDPVHKGIILEREFFENKNKLNDATTFKNQKEIIIQLNITLDQSTENVVLVDLLPAGFEIQNPRLDSSLSSDSANKGTITPAYMDIRDDRLIIMFNQLDKGTHYYKYAVKTVTVGEYDYPPAQAECMYDASVYGRSQYSKIKIIE